MYFYVYYLPLFAEQAVFRIEKAIRSYFSKLCYVWCVSEDAIVRWGNLVTTSIATVYRLSLTLFSEVGEFAPTK